MKNENYEDYNSLIRRLLHGNKYLSSGEKNPLYNPQWGREKGRVYAMAKSYVNKNRDLFLGNSKTQYPVEYTAAGIIEGKAQYNFRDTESILQNVYNVKKPDARVIATDLARLDKLIQMTVNSKPVEYKTTVNGQNVTDIVYPPSYYAQLYFEGKISRQEFFDKIALWEKESNEYTFQAYGK